METNSLQMFDTTIKYSGEDIFIKPLCDFFKIEYDNQLRNIKNDPILQTSAGKNPSMLLFGDDRPRVTLSKRGFLRWIQLINPRLVPENLREKLTDYQAQIFDYLFRSSEDLSDIQRMSAQLLEKRSRYSALGNEIQNDQKTLNELIYARLGISLYKTQNAKTLKITA